MGPYTVHYTVPYQGAAEMAGRSLMHVGTSW